MKRPTIYDVAERAGVSKSLVSLVLRDSSRVSDEKRAAVLAAVAELNYTPSRLAAGLAGTRTRSVGVVIDDFANLWFVEALAGLRQALADDGYSLSVADVSLNGHLGTNPIEVFRSLRVDGIVLAGESAGAGAASDATLGGVPAVVLGVRSDQAPSLPVIMSDEAEGGRVATRHLANLGHRNIVCISAPGASATKRERGYAEAMRERGFEPNIVHAVDTDEHSARAVAKSVLGRDRGSLQPTAVFAVNDPMAVGVIGAARDAGLTVPTDLSVVGYDDSPLAAYGLVSLTSVSGDAREVGEAAGRALTRMITGGSNVGSGSHAREGARTERTPAPRLFTPRLIERTSTAPPAAQE